VTVPPKILALWAAAILALLLLASSLTGSGNGMGGYAPLSHMAWSYAFLLVLAAAIYWALDPLSKKQG
jgi:hypothetical protein